MRLNFTWPHKLVYLSAAVWITAASPAIAAQNQNAAASPASATPQQLAKPAGKPKKFAYVNGAPAWSDGLIHAWLLTESTGDTLQDSVADGQLLTNRDSTDYVWDASGARADSPAINAKLGAGVNFVWTPQTDLSGWTIAVKVRPIGGGGGNNDSRCLWRDSSNGANALYLWKGTLGFYVGANDGQNVLNYTIVPGDDYLIVVDNLGDLYVNGKSLGTFPALLGDITTSGFSWMSDSYNQGFGGLWYFARVWSRILAPDEVAAFTRNPYADLSQSSAPPLSPAAAAPAR